jgi:hypothetical protein
MTTTNTNVFQGGENAIATHYDGRAEKYDTHTTFHATLAREYAGFVEPREGEKVLDLACGTGLVGFECRLFVFLIWGKKNEEGGWGSCLFQVRHKTCNINHQAVAKRS